MAFANEEERLAYEADIQRRLKIRYQNHVRNQNLQNQIAKNKAKQNSAANAVTQGIHDYNQDQAAGLLMGLGLIFPPLMALGAAAYRNK